jgi:hypothetical protein
MDQQLFRVCCAALLNGRPVKHNDLAAAIGYEASAPDFVWNQRPGHQSFLHSAIVGRL